MKTINLGSGVKNIDNWAFDGCNNLSDVYYNNTFAKYMEIYISNFGNKPFIQATKHYVSDSPVPSDPTEQPTETPAAATATPTIAPGGNTPEPEPTATPAPDDSYPYEINELSLNSTNGEILNEIPAGTGFIVNTKFTKVQNRSETDYIFVAVYDTSGALLSLDYVQADFAPNYTYNVGFYIQSQTDEIGSIKAFIWNTFNDMTPLAESKIL